MALLSAGAATLLTPATSPFRIMGVQTRLFYAAMYGNGFLLVRKMTTLPVGSI
jgi:hypothetical protein